MRVAGWIGVLCWCLIVGISTNRAEEPIHAGDWSDPNCFAFEGVKLVPAKKLAQALVGDPPMIQANQRKAPREEILRLIESRLLTGYQACGFPDASVSVEFDEPRQQVVVRVVEGPQFLWGEVRIRGNREISSEELRTWLTAKHPRGKRPAAIVAPDFDKDSPSDAALPPMREMDLSESVRSGIPTGFSPTSLAWLNASIQRGCEDQGYFAARFRAEIQRDAKTSLAHLQIEFEAEGPPAELHDVRFFGLTRHTPDEVLSELQLKRGCSMKGQHSVNLERQLADSGRFVMQRIALLRNEESPSKLNLFVHVEECELTPKLSESLSRKDETLRRFAN
jgi:outer membrane protein assembly factor BamA